MASSSPPWVSSLSLSRVTVDDVVCDEVTTIKAEMQTEITGLKKQLKEAHAELASAGKQLLALKLPRSSLAATVGLPVITPRMFDPHTDKELSKFQRKMNHARRKVTDAKNTALKQATVYEEELEKIKAEMRELKDTYKAQLNMQALNYQTCADKLKKSEADNKTLEDRLHTQSDFLEGVVGPDEKKIETRASKRARAN